MREDSGLRRTELSRSDEQFVRAPPCCGGRSEAGVRCAHAFRVTSESLCPPCESPDNRVDIDNEQHTFSPRDLVHNVVCRHFRSETGTCTPSQDTTV